MKAVLKHRADGVWAPIFAAVSYEDEVDSSAAEDAASCEGEAVTSEEEGFSSDEDENIGTVSEEGKADDSEEGISEESEGCVINKSALDTPFPITTTAIMVTVIGIIQRVRVRRMECFWGHSQILCKVQ